MSLRLSAIILALALLYTLPGCAQQLNTDHVTLSYSQRGGMCDCPSYSVDLESNGQVIYECFSGCAVPGEQYYAVPAERFSELLQAFQREHFRDIPRTDPRNYSDIPIFRLTYRDDVSMHEVVDGYRQHEGLTRLERQFRTAVDAARFEKPSVELYRRLVKAGWNLNTVGKDQQNALTSAVGHKDDESVRFLVENGSAVTTLTMEYAAVYNDLVLFRFLVPPSAIKMDSHRAMVAASAAARSTNPALLRYVQDSAAQ